jgi:Heterokaryon incompatibility protein (HET)
MIFNDLPPRTDDDNCFELARTWINSCVHSHRRCVRLQDTRLPSRVLDVGIHNSPWDPYLLESNGKCGRYVTLSHRWPPNLSSMAPNLSLKTTSQSIDQRRQGIPLSRMPATFRDAVIVCRKLCICYLWIDALCILQDSDEDWAKEAPQMGSVYSNAVFTISALVRVRLKGSLP